MKFVFNVPDLRVMVDADSEQAAREKLDDATCTLEAAAEWELQGFNGEAELLRACGVCGCTEDNACEDDCSWVAEDLCSTDDEAHRVARAALGVEDDHVPLVFEVQA